MAKSKNISKYKCDLDWDVCKEWQKCPYDHACLDLEDDDDYEYSTDFMSISDDELLDTANRLNLFTTIFGG